jgi:hypothetical protein
MPSRQAELLRYSGPKAIDDYANSFETPESFEDNRKWLNTTGDYFRESIATAVRTEHECIENEITASEFILHIGNELGDPDFRPYERATWRRACNFLRRLAIHAHSCGFAGIGTPEIVPASKGSIDLLWRTPDKRLLINFPAGSERPSYYGTKKTNEISGRFDPDESRPDLIFWLASK